MELEWLQRKRRLLEPRTAGLCTIYHTHTGTPRPRDAGSLLSRAEIPQGTSTAGQEGAGGAEPELHLLHRSRPRSEICRIAEGRPWMELQAELCSGNFLAYGHLRREEVEQEGMGIDNPNAQHGTHGQRQSAVDRCGHETRQDALHRQHASGHSRLRRTAGACLASNRSQDSGTRPTSRHDRRRLERRVARTQNRICREHEKITESGG